MDHAAWQACALMVALQVQTASVYSFYPTILKAAYGCTASGVFAGVAAYSIGSVLGKLPCDRIATRIGDRWTMLGCLCVTVPGIVPFVSASAAPVLLGAAVVVGASSSGVFALVPHYLSLRFPNTVRSSGMGLAHALAAGGHGVATYVVPATGRGLGLQHAVELFVVAGSLAVAAIALREPRVLPGLDMDEPQRRQGRKEAVPS